MIYLNLEDALKKIDENIQPIGRTEQVGLFDLDQRVLAEELICSKALPAFDNSGMDGYALHHSDAGKTLPIVGTIFAGDDTPPALQKGTCVKVMTGGIVPEGADVVVPFENALDATESSATMPDSLKAESNVKRKGEEYNTGESIFAKGTRINPFHASMVATQGKMALKCFQRLRIGVLSTGDEIREPWMDAEAHQIYNSNSTGIHAILKHYGFEPDYIGVLPDSLEPMIETIKALQGYDVLFTTGGISMGEADFVQQAFAACGMETIFHGIDVKPGRPTLMGKMGQTVLFSLPGNPLSALINLQFLVLPYLYKMQGVGEYFPGFVEAKLGRALHLKARRANMILGQLDGNTFTAYKDAKYGSGMLSPLTSSDAIIITAQGVSEVPEGASVHVLPIEFPLCGTQQELLYRG